MKSSLALRILSAVLGVVLFLIVVASPQGLSQAEGQKTFSTSQQAVDAFVRAAGENNTADLDAMLGPNSEQIVSSGDDVADRNARQQFVSQYEAKHSLVKIAPNQFTLSVGKDDWPLPIPLVNAHDKWYWNGDEGREEILYRRIGHNELAAINVCKGVVSAQREYAALSHDGKPAGSYAANLVSEPGKEDGLYWEVQQDESASPAGPLLAQANSEGYDTSGKRTPYHGYYYRMLNSPGGFGFLAYPAEYRSSGVMTFIVDQTGVIYQKDLGENTAEIAQQMQGYRLDNTWTRVR